MHEHPVPSAPTPAVPSVFASAIAAAALAFAAPASAVTLESVLAPAGTVVTGFAGASLVSFDIDFGSVAPVRLEFRVDTGDGPSLAFNAMLRNFSSQGLPGYDLRLDRGGFTSIGSVRPQFGGTASVSGTPAEVRIRFSAPEFLDVEIGNALNATPPGTDWLLGGLAAGDRFTLTVSPVPEPVSLALLLAGLGAVGLRVRRRG